MKRRIGRRLLALTMALAAILCPAALAGGGKAADGELSGMRAAQTGGTAMIQNRNKLTTASNLVIAEAGETGLPIGKGGAIAPGGHAGCPSARFADLDSTQWYHEYIDIMIENGYMNGAGDQFDPDGTLTRGMLVAILWRMEGKPVVDAASPFQDVRAEDYFADAVRWAASLGIVQGDGETAFAPNDAITRQQLAVILWRLAGQKGLDISNAGSTVPDFADRDQIAPWAGEAACWAYTRGILTGRGGNRLDPAGTATRAEAAAMLTRFQRLGQQPSTGLAAE